MREIKFRAWDKNHKIMIYFPKNSICDEYSCLCWEAEEGSQYYGIGQLPGAYENCFDQGPISGRYELMQYTGLKDKNGKEIYEGDIVRHPIYTKNLSIIWHDGKYVSMFVASHDGKHGLETIALTVCEVIGNIYENSELLKEET